MICHDASYLVNGLLGELVIFYLVGPDLIYCVPRHIQHVLVRQSIKNAVTPQNYEIVEVRLKGELANLRLRNYDTLLSTIL